METSEMPQRRRQPEGERETSVQPDCPDLLTLSITSSLPCPPPPPGITDSSWWRHPHTSTAKTLPRSLSLTRAKLRPRAEDVHTG